jgi:hypothetical protein
MQTLQQSGSILAYSRHREIPWAADEELLNKIEKPNYKDMGTGTYFRHFQGLPLPMPESWICPHQNHQVQAPFLKKPHPKSLDRCVLVQGPPLQVASVMDLPRSRGEERHEVILLRTAYTPPPPAVQSVPIYFLQVPFG